MQYKDTSQQVLFMYLFKMYFMYLFIFHLVDLSEFLIWKVDPHTKKCGHPCSTVSF